jgi:hypothetical protein
MRRITLMNLNDLIVADDEIRSLLGQFEKSTNEIQENIALAKISRFLDNGKEEYLLVFFIESWLLGQKIFSRGLNWGLKEFDEFPYLEQKILYAIVLTWADQLKRHTKQAGSGLAYCSKIMSDRYSHGAEWSTWLWAALEAKTDKKVFKSPLSTDEYYLQKYYDAAEFIIGRNFTQTVSE